MKDVLIANDSNWQILHWRSICSAYRSSPFFEFYEDDLSPFFFRPFEKLLDFNHEIQKKVLDLLNIKVDLGYTHEYHAKPKGVIDARNSFTKLEQIQAKSSVAPYIQVFESNGGFIPNLSIIDLLFNLGPGSLDMVQPRD